MFLAFSTGLQMPIWLSSKLDTTTDENVIINDWLPDVRLPVEVAPSCEPTHTKPFTSKMNSLFPPRKYSLIYKL